MNLSKTKFNVEELAAIYSVMNHFLDDDVPTDNQDLIDSIPLFKSIRKKVAKVFDLAFGDNDYTDDTISIVILSLLTMNNESEEYELKLTTEEASCLCSALMTMVEADREMMNEFDNTTTTAFLSSIGAKVSLSEMQNMLGFDTGMLNIGRVLEYILNE